MPSISSNQQGGVIRWDKDDWLSGLIPEWGPTEGISSRGFTTMTSVDPHRRPGYLSPGASPINVTSASSITGLLTGGDLRGDNAYLVGGNLVHQLNPISNIISTTSPYPYTIPAATGHAAHSTFVAEDCLVYQVGTTEYIFFSYNDNTDGDIGRITPGSPDTIDPDYMSTVPTGAAALTVGVPHPMIEGDDNVLYVGNGNILAGFDGPTTTFIPVRLTLPTGFRITSFSKQPNFLVIFAYKDSSSGSSTFNFGEAKAFFWDYVSEDPSYIYTLPGNYVNGGFVFQGIVGCFTQGKSGMTTNPKQSRLCLFNGRVFEGKAQFSQNIPRHGGVEVFDNCVKFNAGGQIYQWGTTHFGLSPIFTNIAAGSGSSTGGILKNFYADNLVASTGTSTSGGLQSFSGFATGSVYLALAEPSYPRRMQGRVDSVIVRWRRSVTNSDATTSLALVLDQGATERTVISSLNNLTQNTTEYKFDSSTVALSSTPFYSISPALIFASGSTAPPMPQSIEVHYSNVDINI